jgi:hypothetical protein
MSAEQTQQLELVDASTHDRFATAHVNLLPPAYVQEHRRRRIGIIAMAILVAYVAGLGLVYSVKRGAVADARAERDAVEQQVAVLRTEADALQEYQTLLDTIDTRSALLTSAMEDQLSWARIFGDLALAFDRQSSLIEITAASTAVDAEAVTDAAPTGTANGNDAVAQVAFTGYSVDRFAPGVSEVLSNFESTKGFHDTYLSIATDEDRGGSEVTNFEGRVELDDGAVTHRYDDGLPEETLE